MCEVNGSIRVCERCGVPFAGMGYVVGVSTVLCDECAVELLPLTFEGARWLIQQAADSLVTIPPQGFRWESIRDGFASEMVGEVEDFARVRELAVAAMNEFLRVERVKRSGGAS